MTRQAQNTIEFTDRDLASSSPFEKTGFAVQIREHVKPLRGPQYHSTEKFKHIMNKASRIRRTVNGFDSKILQCTFKIDLLVLILRPALTWHNPSTRTIASTRKTKWILAVMLALSSFSRYNKRPGYAWVVLSPLVKTIFLLT